MRKLPRRLPSNSPSLAWVGFAVLGLAIVGGMGGLYAHRQNQETTKEQLIVDLRAEIEATAEQTRALADEFDVDEVMVNAAASARRGTDPATAPGRDKTLELLAKELF